MSLRDVARWHLHVRGIVQGVGFRPFIHRLAERHRLQGWVLNHSTGVDLEVEGPREALDAFRCDLDAEIPPLAYVEAVVVTEVPPQGSDTFEIRHSHESAGEITLIPPDAATCADCVRELLDPADRRYRYPFTNCTNCGPRYTIIRGMPYDRAATTMAPFRMCAACQAEYEDPRDRRYHAQPNACPTCGPRVRLLGYDGADPIAEAARIIQGGGILGVKGLGGFHLACDAASDAALDMLREAKRRDEKPFALLARDLDTVRRICHVDATEERILTGPWRPILLLRRRDGADLRIGEAVAPRSTRLGVFLPYTPIHHLLMESLTLIVLTSANLSEEPIEHRDAQALLRLHPAMRVLDHDRDIHTRCDDSVLRVVDGETAFVRRSRGYAPRPVTLGFAVDEPILACGAQLKNTFCIAAGHHAWLSGHIGDLDNYETLRAYQDGIAHLATLLELEPRIVAHDLHPDYLSTRHALERAADRRIGVQHHHAHVASVLAEHRLDGRVIGVAFDGTGYGTDGTIWGAEFLVADRADFTRAAHLAEVPLAGGDRAIREPWRVAAAWLQDLYGDAFLDLDLPVVQGMDRVQWRVIQRMIERGVNTPLASSMGRLFDAAAALVLGRARVAYEAQAAMELEMIVDEREETAYAFGFAAGIADPRPVLRALIADLTAGVVPGRVAARFHNAVVDLVAHACSDLRDRHGLERVALSGGVFQNAYLLRHARRRLAEQGFAVYANRDVSCNDSGIALGQIAVAAARK